MASSSTIYLHPPAHLSSFRFSNINIFHRRSLFISVLLSVKATGKAIQLAAGFVGQVVARQAGGFVVDMIRQNKIARRAFLLAGSPGTNKIVLALSISQEFDTKNKSGNGSPVILPPERLRYGYAAGRVDLL
ncbi:hypothetical protein L1987_85979 [Smallanthus sonchifolius]|uniref:Uncharacterized protein n=1 Tax=Smallanthus sonchifolius TaxID=185202 RepID=A0ACB8XY34_9ASTR|nr:hypothetical protein L1987_85979 [Smallanthus sonchifolius]